MASLGKSSALAHSLHLSRDSSPSTSRPRTPPELLDALPEDSVAQPMTSTPTASSSRVPLQFRPPSAPPSTPSPPGPQTYTGGAPLAHATTLPTPNSHSTDDRPTSANDADADAESATPPVPSFFSLSRTTSAPTHAAPIPRYGRSPPNSTFHSRARSSTTVANSSNFFPILPRSPTGSTFSGGGGSTSTSPAPRSDLTSHIYLSGLLQSELSDINIHAFSHVYSLHRMILGQSGFFKLLLSGGFSETGVNHSTSDGVIGVQLDRPLSRKAFEYCLATLYGGGPKLVTPVWARCSHPHPLGEPFERLWLEVNLGVKSEVKEEEVDGMVADPGFLLSLLASATYLEIPIVQKQAFEMIMDSLTPWTIGRFLSYALGNGKVMQTKEEWDEGCLGLEGVGRPYRLSRKTSKASSFETADQFDESEEDDEDVEGETIFVGPEGERVGEACACWLSKWGSEILAVEEWLEAHPDRADALEKSTPPLRLWSSLPGGISAAWVRGVISSDSFFLGSSVTGTMGSPKDGGTGVDGEWERYEFAKRVVELRRRERAKRKKGRRAEVPKKRENGGEGLQKEIERMSLSEGEEDGKCGAESESDEAGCDEVDHVELEEEEEFAELFASGIHYSHLTFAQLRRISQDVSPTTGQPYVSQSIVESALWLSEDFRSRIPYDIAPFASISHSMHANGPARTTQLGRPGVSPARTTTAMTVPTTATSVSDEDLTELGFSTTINPSLDDTLSGIAKRPYYLVPVDDTVRLNDGPPPGSSEAPVDPALKFKSSMLPSGPAGFFGLGLETRLGSPGPKSGVFGTTEEQKALRRFVMFEPLRFSAEFWGVGDLKDKQRLYSQTFFLGGSYYNLYLQRIQKKGVQLGVYLHRQSGLEGFPTPSRPPVPPPAVTRAFGLPSAIKEPMATGPTGPSRAPYVDKRNSIKAFLAHEVQLRARLVCVEPELGLEVKLAPFRGWVQLAFLAEVPQSYSQAVSTP
ncbi:hypothetical protein MNV49_006882 [Pseudohyphozyma bogoriensis]|nr:hypothetical protein MNV49_006882 [Pseudohyphozyma bogoriensis]